MCFVFRAAASTFAVVAAGPALALSCLVPTVQQTYRTVDDSPETFVIAHGSVTATGPSIPPEGAVALGGDPNQMVGYTQQARFEGTLFTGTGFTQSWSQQITADVSCVSAWCGSYQDLDSALFFFRQASDGTYWLDIGACPGNVFQDVSQLDLQQVTACYQNGDC